MSASKEYTFSIGEWSSLEKENDCNVSYWISLLRQLSSATFPLSSKVFERTLANIVLGLRMGEIKPNQNNYLRQTPNV